MSRLASAACVAFVCLLEPTVLPRNAQACMVVSKEPVVVEGEEALIVWDAKKKREYFIRRADFQGARGSFGFVVPTPSRPKLEEVDDEVFRRLAELYQKPSDRSIGGAGEGLARGGKGSRVEVVERTHVAGLEATVISASDAGALSNWLRKHGYPAPAGLQQWLTPYVKQGFFVTAFRYEPQKGKPDVRSKAVMMSFDAPRAFFPYSEPSGARRGKSRVFRVTLVSERKMTALEGDKPWKARVAYAAPTLSIHGVLPHALPTEAVPYRPWVTTFEETDSKRAGADLYFTGSDDVTSVAPSVDTAVAPRTARENKRGTAKRALSPTE